MILFLVILRIKKQPLVAKAGDTAVFKGVCPFAVLSRSHCNAFYIFGCEGPQCAVRVLCRAVSYIFLNEHVALYDILFDHAYVFLQGLPVFR